MERHHLGLPDADAHPLGLLPHRLDERLGRRLVLRGHHHRPVVQRSRAEDVLGGGGARPVSPRSDRFRVAVAELERDGRHHAGVGGEALVRQPQSPAVEQFGCGLALLDGRHQRLDGLKRR